jgi:hypothetical protein
VHSDLLYGIAITCVAQIKKQLETRPDSIPRVS